MQCIIIQIKFGRLLRREIALRAVLL